MTEKELSAIQARVDADLAGAGVPLLDSYQRDIPVLLAEVRRLRADRHHARAWVTYWRHTALKDGYAASPDPAFTALDGWDGFPPEGHKIQPVRDHLQVALQVARQITCSESGPSPVGDFVGDHPEGRNAP